MCSIYRALSQRSLELVDSAVPVHTNIIQLLLFRICPSETLLLPLKGFIPPCPTFLTQPAISKCFPSKYKLIPLPFLGPVQSRVRVRVRVQLSHQHLQWCCETSPLPQCCVSLELLPDWCDVIRLNQISFISDTNATS